MINDYTAIDLETTGLNPKYDKIIEIGAVKVKDHKVVDRYQQLIRPGKTLSEHVVQLTGITQEALEDAPDLTEVLPEVLAWIGEDVLLGHRVLFDYSFLKKAAVNQGLWKKEHQSMGLDTLRLSRIFLPELPSRKLSDLCEHYRITHHAHRALGDAESTVQLYQILEERFYDEKIFAPFPLIYQIKKESPMTKAQKEQLYRLMEQHKIVLDDDVDQFTRNEASRIIDRIYLQYGRNVPLKEQESASD